MTVPPLTALVLRRTALLRVPSRFAVPGALALCLAAQPAAQTDALVEDLRVEHQVEHLGVPAAAPRFSWSIVDPDRGARQSAYQLLVASTRELLDQDLGDLWDSGQVTSSAQHLVEYAGSPLDGAQRYHWKVRTWDEVGTESAWSEASTFDTALDSQDWIASFLWDGTEGDNDTAYFRKSLPLDEGVDLGKVFVTAHDEFALWVNGVLVGRGPAPADPHCSLRVVPFDVTDLLVVGENVFAARAHWDGGLGHSGVRGEGVFALQAELDLAGGSRTTLATDGTWRVLESTPYDETAPVRGPAFAEASTVEDFDARLEPPGWRRPGFDDSTWALAPVISPGFVVQPQEVPASIVVEEIPPVSITPVAPGVQLVDFGRNVTGWVRMSIVGMPPGRQVTMYYSEEVVGGRIVRDRDRITDMFDVYTTRGGIERFEPDIDVLGFRYIEVEGLPSLLDASSVSLQRFGTALEPASTFSSSSTVLDDVLRISVETQEACAQGILADCMTREQTQFIMDAYIQGWNLSWNYRESNLLPKTVQDLRESDVGAGVLSARHPTEGFVLLAEWMLSWILTVEQAWWTSGDERIPAANLELVEVVLDTFAAFVEPTSGLIESLPANAYPFLGVDITENGLQTLNAFYVGALRAAARIATAAGDPVLADQWTLEADALADAVHAAHYLGGGAYARSLDSGVSLQLNGALALLYDIVPDDEREAVRADVRAQGLATETVGGFFATQTMIDEGFADELVAALEDSTQHWGAILAADGTSTWESWQPTFSLAHAWSAYPMLLAMQGLLGIEPTAPGWTSIAVRPQLSTGMSFADGSLTLPQGAVHVRWEDSFPLPRVLEVTVPANVDALVSVPTRDYEDLQISESGFRVYPPDIFEIPVEGLTLDGVEDDFVRFLVEPGTYRFEVRGLRAAPAPTADPGPVEAQ